MRCYTIGTSRLGRACMENINMDGKGTLHLDSGSEAHALWLAPLDGGGDGTWGRLRIDMDLPPDAALRVYAIAGDEKERISSFLLAASVNIEKKRTLFDTGASAAIRADVQADIFPGVQGMTHTFRKKGDARRTDRYGMLLYRLKGRYLWLGMEVYKGAGGSIHQIKVTAQDDGFLNSFPDIYRERDGTFHRFISAFAAVCQDFREDTQNMWERFDLEKADDDALTEMAAWLGLRTGEGLLTHGELKEITAQAHIFVRMKGTPDVVKHLTRLLTGETPLIVEKANGEVTLLLYRRLTEEEELRLLFFLTQFIPVYSRLNILSYEEETGLDGYCFSDCNTQIPQFGGGSLDSGSCADGCTAG